MAVFIVGYLTKFFFFESLVSQRVQVKSIQRWVSRQCKQLFQSCQERSSEAATVLEKDSLHFYNFQCTSTWKTNGWFAYVHVVSHKRALQTH